MSTATTIYPEYLLGHTPTPRSQVFERFGDQRDATRLDWDMVRARHFEPGTQDLKKEAVR